jgi:hypothetical protein
LISRLEEDDLKGGKNKEKIFFFFFLEKLILAGIAEILVTPEISANIFGRA